jgi:prophage antirepressor-like protein
MATSAVPLSAPALALVSPVPPNCSFTDKKLVLDGKELPFIHYNLGAKDEIWFPAKPVMRITGETTITQCLDRVAAECKMSLKDLVAAKGLPEEGCCGFTTPPNPDDYNQGKAMWVDESGFYAILLGSRKPQCASFQRWVLQEVLPSIRRSGSYHTPGSGASPQALQEAVVAMELRLSATLATAATSAVTAAMAQVQQQHGVLEISRSRLSAQSERLRVIGTVVDDRTLQGVQDEGGMLAVSVFLQEAGVENTLLRRLLPSFAEEAGRRKLESWHSERQAGAAGPLWIAWSQCAWRLLYTEADRQLLCEVFEDPLTRQQLQRLEASRQPSRAAALAQGPRRRRIGPYARPLQGSSSAVSPQSIQRFFSDAAAAAAAAAKAA